MFLQDSGGRYAWRKQHRWKNMVCKVLYKRQTAGTSGFFADLNVPNYVLTQ